MYKSKHLIITSRFTNAIVFNPPVLVGTDNGLTFLCVPCCHIKYVFNGAYLYIQNENATSDMVHAYHTDISFFKVKTVRTIHLIQ